MPDATPRKYHVAVWGPGSVGVAAIRDCLLIDNADLVGVLAYSPDKQGRDIGELVGFPATGTKVSATVEELLATRPECVLFAARDYGDLRADDDIATLLEAGVNVVSALPYQNLETVSPERFARLDAAGKKGGATLFGSGVNPGYMMERLALTLSGLSNGITGIRLREYINCTHMPGAATFLQLMGFGMQTVDAAQTEQVAALIQSYLQPTLQFAAEKMGVPIDRIERTDRHEVAPETMHLPEFTIEKGGVALVSHKWTAYRGNTPFLSTHSTWFVTDAMRPPELKGLDDCWIIEVDGRPSSRTIIELHGSPDRDGSNNPENPSNTSYLATMVPMVQSIPYVVDATPGVLTLDAPPMHWRADFA
ncbi:MAG: hypothetical protein P8Y58_09960 [Novosphingobium sp.]